MKIERVSFPQPAVCRVEVREDAAAYEAAVQRLYERRRRFYPVPGWPAGDAPLDAIEARYGADTFRAEAIDQLLLQEFPALRAALCAERSLFPLTDSEPELLRLGGDGFAAACTFAVAPPVQLAAYTGRTAAGESQTAALDALLDALAQESGAAPPEYAVRVLCEERLETLRQRLQGSKTTLAQFLERTQKTQAELEADLRAAAAASLARKIVLVQVARSEGLFPTQAQLDAELDRMASISAQNRYARTNPAAQQSIAQRLALHNAREFLQAHNTLSCG